jgi:AraC-like DNA-binding protein/mannose-6-phosphate isomerase-like protein (cupin superfamily)
MKAEDLGLLDIGCDRRNRTAYFSRRGHTRFRGQKPQLQDNPVSPMTLDWAIDQGIDTCEPQLLAAQTGKIRMTALSKGHYPGVAIPSNTLPGLNSIGFWDGAGPQNWGLNVHRNEGIEIHFVETGNMVFVADERRFNLNAGDLTITRPWQLHQLGDPYIGPGRVHWLILDVGVRSLNDQWRWPGWVTMTPADLAELTNKLRRNKMPVCKSTTEIARIFQQIAACVGQWQSPHCVSRLTAHLNQLFVSFLDLPTTQTMSDAPDTGSNRRVVELFLKELQENPAKYEDIRTLPEMAEHCRMGITSFAKYTREFVNVGPMEFLKQCRLNRAAQQLRQQPGASITDVCFSNGFNSSQYFATCFRKQFKMSPSEFIATQC